MESLIARIDELIASDSVPWHRDGNAVRVELEKGSRAQVVRFARNHDRYVFRSTVLSSKQVTTTSDRAWRDLAYRAWRRNAAKELVTFSFDEKDALIGVIEVSAATLDREELQIYVETLAKECDRFEYALTGQDVE